MGIISISGDHIITSLGDVLEEEIQIDNKLISLPRPLGGTDDNTAINLFGKQRRITISGSHDGTGYPAGGSVDANIALFVADIEAWINTNIQTTATYTNSLGQTYTVLTAVFRWTRTAPGTRILYVLTMVEGSAVAAFSP